MKTKNIYFFVGTTAELIKTSPVIREFKQREINLKIVTSGQNTINFNEFKPLMGKVKPYYSFRQKSVKLPKFILIMFSIWIVKSLINYFLFFRNELKKTDSKNSLFIVHGDTASSLLGSVIAKIYNMKIVHIESGLRSFNFLEPFPEELSRFVISHLAEVHFCPNEWAVENLKNLKGVKINTFNNTLLESTLAILKDRKKIKSIKFLKGNKFFLLVLHRQEHIFFKKQLMKKYLKLLTSFANQNLNCVLVLHKLTEKFLKQEGLMSQVKKDKNIIFVPRLPYTDFINLMPKAEFIATDGGSNQEEAYYLGKPCLILRNRTERIEGLGENAVLSKGSEDTIRQFINNYKNYQRGKVKIKTPPSKIIVDYLLNHQY